VTLEVDVEEITRETDFSGVVRVDRGDDLGFAKAYGLADRRWDIANTIDTRFGIASGTKAMTALVVVGLVESGALELDTTARSVLGDDLPLIGDDVTVEHLLAHRSGIGDYFDENEGVDVADYVLPVPVHELATTEQFLSVLGGFPTKFAPDTQFAYNNGGYVVLALIAERVSGVAFAELVQERVCRPAGMHDTAFSRSDALPDRTALGYVTVDGVDRTNVFHLPVLGTGDGGIFTTAADVARFWRALFAGAIVPDRWVAEMVRPRSVAPELSMRYGLGFWLHESTDVVMLEGCDAGVSFRTVHDPRSGLTHTVLSNTTDGAWPVTRLLDDRLGL
jgi:CubicO group peptidase (beta-lactamase class C family)